MKLFMAIVVSLALIGSVLGNTSQYRLKNEYFRYEGQIMTSVFNPKQSHSGIDLKMDITLTRNDEETYFSFQNVRSTKFNQEFFYPEEIPRLSGQQEPVKQLEGNFTVFLGRDSGVVMRVPKGEEIWVTNIRKAIVSLFRIPAYVNDYKLRHQMSSQDAVLRLSYKEREALFAGRCNVGYSTVMDYNNGSYPGSSPPGSFNYHGAVPELYLRVRRSIDFDSCQSASRYTKAGFGNFSTVQNNTFQRVQQRSFVGQYAIVKVKSQQQPNLSLYYIRGANVQGAQIIKPFGQETGRLAILTNQTLYSVQQQFPRQPLSSSQQDVSTWVYQFTSPAAPKTDGKHQAEWVKYQSKSDILAPVYPEYAILGRHPRPQEELLSYAKQTLEDVTRLQQAPLDMNNSKFNGTTDGRLVERLRQLSSVIRALERPQIETLWQSVAQGGSSATQKIRKQAFLDAASVSGSSAAIDVLITAFKKNEVDAYRQATLLSTLVGNIHDPASVHKVMEYVMTIDPERQLYLGSLSHLNVAKLLQKVCVNHQLKNYTVPDAILGTKVCEKSTVDKFIQHLKQKFESSSKDYLKMLYVQSLGRVGDGETISYIKKIFTPGYSQETQVSSKVKVAAIYALSKSFPLKKDRYQIIDAMLSIVQAPSEVREVREVALMSLIEQRPNATVYQRLAMGSWYEPDMEVRSMITSVFTTLAQARDRYSSRTVGITRKLLPLMRPDFPSYRHSGFYPRRDPIIDFNTEMERSFYWYQKYRSPTVPRQMFQRNQGLFGGIPVPLYEMFSIIQGQQLSPSSDILKTLTSAWRNQQDSMYYRQQDQQYNNRHPRSRPVEGQWEQESHSSSRDPQAKRMHEHFQRISDSMKIGMVQSSGSEPQLYFTMGAYDVEAFLPVDEFTLPKIVEAIRASFKNSGKTGSLVPVDAEHSVKFMNPVDIVIALPTSFGLPSIFQVQTPSNFYWGNTFAVKPDQSNPKNVNITVDGITKYTYKAQSYATVIVPWTNKVAVAAYDTEATVSLPGKVSVVMNATFPYLITKMDVSPNFKGERPVMYYRTRPFTAVQSDLSPAADITVTQELNVPLANNSHSYNVSHWFQESIYQQKAHLEYQGDAQFPINQGNIWKVFENPSRMYTLLTSPTQHDVACALKLDIEASQAKNISLGMIIDYARIWNGPRSAMLKKEKTTLTGEKISEALSHPAARSEMSLEKLAGIAQQTQGEIALGIAANFTQMNVKNQQVFLVLSVDDQLPTGQDIHERQYTFNSLASITDRKMHLTCTSLNVKEKASISRSSDAFATVVTKVYDGPCSTSRQSEAINAKAEFYLTTQRPKPKSSVGSDPAYIAPMLLPRDRRYDPSEVTGWKNDAYVSYAEGKITFNPSTPAYLQNVTYIMRDWIAAYAYPHLVVDRMSQSHLVPANTVQFFIKRNNYTGTLDAVVKSPQYNAVVQQLPISAMVDWITPLMGEHFPLIGDDSYQSSRLSIESGIPSRRHHHKIVNGRASSKMCQVMPTQVHTFDRNVFSKSNGECEQTLLHIVSKGDEYTLTTRQPASGSGENSRTTLFIKGTRGPKIEVIRKGDKPTVLVNGQEIDTSKPYYDIHYDNDAVIGRITFPSNRVEIVLWGKMKCVCESQEKVTVFLSHQYSGQTRGLCGTADRDSNRDLVSIDTCLMTPSQGKEFAASYITDVNSCNNSQLKSDWQSYEQIKRGSCKKSFSRNQA